MKTLLTSILVVLLATLVASPASATLIFFDDFNDDTVGTLEGQAANTGQVWGNGPWAGLALNVGTTYGQGGTNGISTPGSYSDSWVDVGTTTSSGEYTLAVDIANTYATGGERTLYLLDATALKNMSVGWVGGNILFEGGYATHAAVPAGFSTGNIKIQLTFNVDETAGSVRWWDIDDPGDLSTRGDVSLGAFTGPAGGYTALKNIMAFQTHTANGFDNISLATGGPSPFVPEPSTLALLATGLLGLVCYAWRKRK